MRLTKITFTDQVRFPGLNPGTIDVDIRRRDGWSFELKGPRFYMTAPIGWQGAKEAITFEAPRSAIACMWIGNGAVPVDWTGGPTEKPKAEVSTPAPSQGEGDDDASDVMPFAKGKRRG